MYGPRARAHLARCLADAFLAGAWSERALTRRGGSVLEHRPRWLLGVVRDVLGAGGRSARSHAAEHTGRRVVLSLDCEDFFAHRRGVA